MKHSVINPTKHLWVGVTDPAQGGLPAHIEPLEHRIAPAVVLTPIDIDGDGASDDVQIVGDGLKNIVTIVDNGVDTLTISIDANGDGVVTGKGDLPPTNFSFSGSSVALNVRLGGGNDVLNYSVTADLSAASRLLFADLGSGKNAMSFSTGTHDLLNNSLVQLAVTGGSAGDVVSAAFNQVRKSAAIVDLALGQGNDAAALTFDRIDEGSSVDLWTDLGSGANTASIDLQEVGFADTATVNIGVWGGAGKDQVTLSLHDDVGNGTKASRVYFQTALGAGDDTFVTKLDYTGSTFRVDDHAVASIEADGGAGNDSLSVVGVGNQGTIRLDPDAQLAIDLRGGAGNDSLTVDLGKTNALELLGEVRARLDGGSGKDTLAGLLAYNANTTGRFDVAMLGGQSDDAVSFQFSGAAGGTPTFGPSGKVLLDGGLGRDVLTNSAAAIAAVIGFEQIA